MGSRQISVTVESDFKKELEAMAKIQGISVSSLAGQLIQSGMSVDGELDSLKVKNSVPLKEQIKDALREVLDEIKN